MLPLSKEKCKNLELAKLDPSTLVFLEKFENEKCAFQQYVFFEKKRKKIHKKQKLTHKDMAPINKKISI